MKISPVILTMQQFRLVRTLFFSLLVISCSDWTLGEEPSEQVVPHEKAVLSIDASGRVRTGDIFAAIADDVHWIAGRVAGFTSIRQPGAKEKSWVSAQNVEALTRLFPHIFSIHADASQSGKELHVDKTELAIALAEKKSRLRRKLATAQDMTLHKLVPVERTWKKWEAVDPLQVERIVVLLSGLHGLESGGHNVALRLHKESQIPMSVYEYPNDAPLLESASGFCRVITELQQQYPSARVSVVAHSMGGLIARAAIELPEDSYSGQPVSLRTNLITMPIDQLIQVCPPNHGSVLAQYAQLLEAFEQVHRWSSRNDQRKRVFLRTIVDGFNEAPDDLQPNSAFLEKLNQCVRNDSVQYSILAGNDGPLKARANLLLNVTWSILVDAIEQPPELQRAVSELVECSELQAGKGDGVVSIESALLDGVNDFQVLGINHLTWGTLQDAGAESMLKEIAQRLSRHHVQRTQQRQRF